MTKRVTDVVQVVRRRNESTSEVLEGEDIGSELDLCTSNNLCVNELIPNNNDDNDEDSGISDHSASENSTLVIEQQLHSHDSDSVTKTDDHSSGLCSNFVQIFFPFLIAGGGMMLAGILLDYVQVSSILLVLTFPCSLFLSI